MNLSSLRTFKLIQRFISLFVFVAGLFFVVDAYAADKMCSEVPCNNIAKPLNWIEAWGRLPNEKIPLEQHEIKKSINLGVTGCAIDKMGYDDISVSVVDYRGEGRYGYVLDVSKFFTPNNTSPYCPQRLYITENDKIFHTLWLYRSLGQVFNAGDYEPECAKKDCEGDDCTDKVCDEIIAVEKKIKDSLLNETPPCTTDECPWRYVQLFGSDFEDFNPNGGIYVADWRFMTVEDYEKETDNSILFKPYATQFYTEYEIEESQIKDFDACVSEAVSALESKARGERPLLANPVCEKTPSKMPGYMRAKLKQMYEDRPVLRIETPVDREGSRCSIEERLIWDGFYGVPTCIKYYQFGADNTFVDLFLPDVFPHIERANASRMTYHRFPWTIQEGITFDDDPTVDCTELNKTDPEEAAKRCNWRIVKNGKHIQASYPADGKFLESFGNSIKKDDPVYPADFYDVAGAMALEFTTKDGTFYCKDINNDTKNSNASLDDCDLTVMEDIISGGSGNVSTNASTSGGKTFLVPARTDDELISFINAVESGSLDKIGMSTKVKSSTADIWYKELDVKGITASCERKIVAPKCSSECRDCPTCPGCHNCPENQGYWDGDLVCPELPCQRSKGIFATRQCMRSTGLQEDCESCVSLNPDIVPEPKIPEGNIHTGAKGMCVFYKMCVNETPCVPCVCIGSYWHPNLRGCYQPEISNIDDDGRMEGYVDSAGLYQVYAKKIATFIHDPNGELHSGFVGSVGSYTYRGYYDVLPGYDISKCEIQNQGMWSCFTENVKILMADGSEKKVIDVKKGDMVMGFNISDPKASLKPAKIASQTIRDNVYIKINELELTPEHSLVLSSGKPIFARLVKVGDKLLDAKGEIVEVKTVDLTTTKARVYNLFLEDADGFVAGGIRVLSR